MPNLTPCCFVSFVICASPFNNWSDTGKSGWTDRHRPYQALRYARWSKHCRPGHNPKSYSEHPHQERLQQENSLGCLVQSLFCRVAGSATSQLHGGCILFQGPIPSWLLPKRFGQTILFYKTQNYKGCLEGRERRQGKQLCPLAKPLSALLQVSNHEALRHLPARSACRAFTTCHHLHVQRVSLGHLSLWQNFHGAPYNQRLVLLRSGDVWYSDRNSGRAEEEEGCCSV